MHVDWQGGWAPSFAEGEQRRFIRPRTADWHSYASGNTCRGYRFGSGDPILARVYNKTAERAKRSDEGYAAVLVARHGSTFDPGRDVWRLEFELHREALASLKLAKIAKLAPESDAEDADADIEAELSAEELPHVGTLPKLFAHLDAIFLHLSYHWLRLVVPSGGSVRSRWPLDPTWALLPHLGTASLGVRSGGCGVAAPTRCARRRTGRAVGGAQSTAQPHGGWRPCIARCRRRRGGSCIPAAAARKHGAAGGT
jgi:hypothetical protein